MQTIRLGTIGSGFIVHNLLDNFCRLPGFRLEAVYSRSHETGAALAAQYGAEKVYTDLAQLLADPAVNCVYIASPNSLHYAHTKAALLAGKHVICEKPFCPTAAQAAELISLAKERALLLVDATPTAYLPNLRILKEQLPKIGRVRAVMGNYSQYSSRYDRLLAGEITNVFDPNFAGGCLMDINYYNLYLNIVLFGKPRQAEYAPNLWKNGIDTSGCLTLRYDDFVSTNVGAKDTWGMNFFQIEGEDGHIFSPGGVSSLEELRVVTKEGTEIIRTPHETDLWGWEVNALADMIGSGNTEPLREGLDTMLCVIDTIESARKAAGIHFPGDKET